MDHEIVLRATKIEKCALLSIEPHCLTNVLAVVYKAKNFNVPLRCNWVLKIFRLKDNFSETVCITYYYVKKTPRSIEMYSLNSFFVKNKVNRI